MYEIDFLPDECRQKHQRRRAQPWLVATTLVVIGLVVAAAAVQHHRRLSLDAELASIASTYEHAVSLQNQLTEVRQRLALAEASAELYTYLRHPWPRTQLLSALVTPLPDGIALHRVQMSQDPSGAMLASKAAAPLDKAEQDRIQSLPAASRDLQKLRARFDSLPTVVQFNGAAIESGMLHRYLGQLDALEVFHKADLDFFNSADNGRGDKLIQFRAVLAVQPGYGQPGGPGKKTRKATADNTSKTVASRNQQAP